MDRRKFLKFSGVAAGTALIAKKLPKITEPKKDNEPSPMETVIVKQHMSPTPFKIKDAFYNTEVGDIVEVWWSDNGLRSENEWGRGHIEITKKEFFKVEWIALDELPPYFNMGVLIGSALPEGK